MIPSLSWVWRWKDQYGITHSTTDRSVADEALHSRSGVLVLGFRVPECEGVMIKGNEEETICKN